MNDVKRVRKAVESTFDGVCSIFEYKTVQGADEISRQREEEVYSNVPCKLSYELNYPLRQTDAAAVVSQRVKLFIAPEVEVKNGSKIVVEQLGKRVEYGFSGETAVYPTHREIRLSPFVKRA